MSATIPRSPANSKKPPNDTGRPTTTKTRPSKVDSLMTSLQCHMPNNNIQDAEQKNQIHIIDITKSPPTKINPAECGDIIEFQTKEKHEYNIFQVYRDGDDYYRVDNGLELENISTRTPANDSRMLFSFELPQDQSEMNLYFCVIQSSKYEILPKTRKCPKKYCENNRFKIEKRVQKISLTDEEKNQKVYLHKGDTIELNWSSKHGTTYRIEEMKYCPISGGLYTVEQTSDRALSEREYSKTFNEFGMSFLFRWTDTNQIRDITVCVIDEKYQMKHIKITDNYIRPNFTSTEENIISLLPNTVPIEENVISIEQNDWIMFEWDTSEKTTLQIGPFLINEHQQRSFKSRNASKHFFWPYGPAKRGCMYHQFKETGVFCYKTANDQIGTIIVEPRTTIHKLDLFSDQLSKEKKWISFNSIGKKKHSQEEPILLTVDSNTKVVPDEPSHPNGTFHCSVHQCREIEPFFHYHFHTCETFLINISQYGLYNFSYSDNPDTALISVIVENAIQTHVVSCDEENIYEPQRKEINRFDQVLFVLSSSRRANRIYQTDKYGHRLEPEEILLCQPQENSINYFMKPFPRLGIYYFSTDIQNHEKGKAKQSATYPLTIIVLPEIRFHYKDIRKGNFDSQIIVATNTNDIVIWHFQKLISHDVIKLRSNETYQQLISCHDKAITGRNRRCIAFNCKRIQSGKSFFCNPDFERVTGSDKDRLISTIIIDPPFVQNCFVITNKQFVPNILYIAKNDTVSWILTDNDPNHRIYIQSNTNDNEDDENIFSDRNMAEYVVDGGYHLHTFNKPGQYIIKSDRFRNTATATVIVYSDIRPQKGPQIKERIDPVSQLDKEIHFALSNNRSGNIYYTLDGSSPTRRDKNVHKYYPNEGVHFREPGLHILRAYATDDQKISSFITTSRPTFVMGNEESEQSSNRGGDITSITEDDPPKTLRNNCQIRLSVSIQHSNKIHVKVDIEPRHSIDLIDYFKLYVNDSSPKMIYSKDFYYSIHGFTAAKRYKIHVVAYPKHHIYGEPISSNREVVVVDRKIQHDLTDVEIIDLSYDSKHRARFLLEKLRQAIENGSKGFNSTATHPHISFPGLCHYMDNQFLSPILHHVPCSPKSPAKSNRYSSLSIDSYVVTTKHRSIRTSEPLENSRFFPVEIAVSIGKKDH